MAQEQPNIDCIYDFIYLDRNRLTSYLAQLNDDGVLLSIKKTGHLIEEQKNFAGAGVSSTKAGSESTEKTGKQSERHFDSTWTALYSVIDRLDELGLIKRNIEEAAIGQLLLCSGSLVFQDIRMMRDLWDPIMNYVLHQQLGQAGNKHNKRTILKQQGKEFELLKQILTGLPHAMLMTLFSGKHSLWSSLDEENMNINSDDITLKHGANFAGHWHVLSILDAKPDIYCVNESRKGNEMFIAMMEMLNAIRTFLGRPADAYGITPIAIFRTIKC